MKSVLASVAMVAAASVLAACGASSTAGGGSSGGTADKDAVLRVAYPVGSSLDPHDAPEPAQLTIGTWPVYDRLLQVTPEAQYAPMLATRWAFSEDGKELTLDLRHGVTFSDGTPFDAEAVKANLDDYVAAKGTALQANVADIAKVDVVDADTVTLTLAKPSTAVLSALSSTLGGVMISPKALGSKDLASHPVGTGAYVVKSFSPGQEVVYERRTDSGGIWDDKTGKPAEVKVTTMDSDAQANAVLSGQIDMTSWSSSSQRFKAQLDSKQLVHTVMSGVLNVVGVNFNKTMKPFDEPAVRQAVNYAINREALREAFMPDADVRVQPWPDGLPGFEESREDTYPYDPAKAKALLADAGHPDGLDAGEMLVAMQGAFPQAAESIQADLAAVGIKVELRSIDTYTLVTQWAGSKAGSDLMQMSLPSIDSYSWLNRLFVNPVWTPGGADPQLTALIAGTDDPSLSSDETAARVGQAVDYATQNAFYAPLWQGVGGFISSTKVKGLDHLASVNGGVADLRNVYLAK